MSSPAAATDRLDEFLRPFAATFRRRDQARWFQLYVRGLLHSGSRKTIEAMVRALQSDLEIPIRDLPQALQNFLNQSPWDERQIWQSLRRAVLERLASTNWIAVLDEVSFVKQGQHSVGVHRQYSGDSERKQNCQVAIVLTAVAGDVALPLACRLYLPRNWASDPARLKSGGVPEEHHVPATRGDIALGLLDGLAAEQILPPAVVAGPRYAASRDFRDGLARRAPAFLIAVDSELQVHAEPAGGFSPLLSHGNPASARSILPLNGDAPALRKVLVAEDDGLPRWLVADWQGNHFLAQFGNTFSAADASEFLRARTVARTAWQDMKARLGLDHFEGRSWRGFHHHASLVALAYSYDVLERDTDRASHDVIF